MKKGNIYDGYVEKVEFPNRGYVRVTIPEEERTPESGDTAYVWVKNVIPGQTVRFRFTKRRSGGKMEGLLHEVLKPSDLETSDVRCPHFGICGGCVYQTVPEEKQLEIKKEQVLHLLEPVCPELHFEGIYASPDEHEYRNKMEYTFGDECKDGPFALGHHRRGGFYDIITTDQCCIVNGDFRKVLRATKEFFEKRQIPFYQKVQHTGYLRHLLVRRTANTSQLLVDLVTSTNMAKEEEKALLDEYVKELRGLDLSADLRGILHTCNDSAADVVKDEGTTVLFGEDYITEELLGLHFKISPFSFFQTNSRGAEVLYGKVREFALDGGEVAPKTIFDLYSGTGTIAQILAPVAEHVTGVEIVEEAVEAAKINAGLNGLTNCDFIAGDVLKVVDELTEKPDLIILDPPREGIHPKAIHKIIGFGVKRMVYVSCKPTSLARDLEILQKAGYRVKKTCCVDMFPSTANIETVCLLSNRKPDSYVHLNLKMEDYYRIKDAQKEQDKK